MSKTQQTFWELIESFRSKRKHGERPTSITHLAEMCGISRNYFYRVANGESEPSDYIIERISAGLGIRVKEVYECCLEQRRRNNG